MAHSQDKASDFDFPDIISEWKGYVSSVDRTNLAPDVIVRGSQNVYKKLSGTMAVRQGQKRQGVANAITSPISSKFVWNTSSGAIYTLVVSNSTLSVVINKVWYTLLTGLTSTRYVFDKLWDNTQKKDELLFVNGSSNMQKWSGGFGTVASTSTTGISILGNNALLTQFGAITGTAPFVSQNNSLVGISQKSVVIFSSNPTNGQTLVLNANGASISVQFVSAIGAAAGNVLIGATLANTITNLIGLLTAPSASNATQIAFSGPNQTIMGYLTSAATNTITMTSPITNFSTKSGEMLIMINGVQYTYTGFTGNTFYGVTPDPTPITVNAIALQSVITYSNIPAAGFNADYIKVINNQAYVGSYTSNLTYIASQDNFADYVVPVPRVAGSPELVILDGTGKGIGIRQGNAVIGFGSSGFAVVSFADVTVGTVLTNVTTVDIKPLALLQAPLAHEFIDNVGDNLIYLSQDQQVREFGDFNNAFVAVYPSLSQEIATELSQENFTGGGLRCIGEFIYVTAPDSGKTYLYQVRNSVSGNGTVIAERLWHSPFIWNATSIDVIDGVIVVFSNANPQIYEVWNTNQWHDDSPSDEPLPYTCIMALSYRGEQRRQGMWSFDKQFTEGYITPGTPLNLQMNYNYEGVTNVINAVVNSTTQPGFIFQVPLASLGDNSLGDEPLGNGGIIDTAQDPNTLPKFKVINSLGLTNCFEWQPIYYSDAVNAQWEILAIGDNAGVEEDQQATFLINKKPISMV